MKQLLFLLLLPCLALAQYTGNAGQKITLGEQTTADGLVFRGVASIDTVTATSKITRANKQDTSAFLLLDTVTNLLWHYKTGSNGWIQAGGSTLDTATMLLPYYRNGRALGTPLSATLTNATGLPLTTGVTGTLAVANGGTNRTTMPAGYILHGDGTSVDTAVDLFWNRTDRYLGLGTNSPAAILQINSATTTPTMAFSQSFSNTSAQRGAFVFYNNNNSTVASVIAQAVTDNVGTDLEFYTRPVAGSLTKNMVILNNGNVGIGTASPTYRLQIKGTLQQFLQVETTSGGGYGAGFDAKNPSLSGGFFVDDATLGFQINEVRRFSIKSDGNVGIGTASPAEKLHVVGNGRFTAVAAGTFANNLNITSDGTLTTATSDEKYKYNILPITYGLNTILQLKPVNFQWIEGEENDLGFIAQDVAEIIPEAVNTNWNSDLLMRYESIIPILTKAIQEQQALIKALEQRILTLENK